MAMNGSRKLADVRFWPKADIGYCAACPLLPVSGHGGCRKTPLLRQSRISKKKSRLPMRLFPF
jgi:hypothetical protein